MISLEEAQARLIALAEPLPAEMQPLGQCFGRYAAADIAALRTQPAKDLSAMDGYALRHAAPMGPWRVIGESAAGNGFPGRLGAGESVRIFTGAPLPKGADTVIMQEDIIRDGDMISLNSALAIPVGHHVRRAGSDFSEAAIVIAEGERLTPARIGLAAMAGHAMLSVRRLPRVAIISTGNELVPPGTAPGPDQIPASNGIMLHAMLADEPCIMTDLGIIPDDLNQISMALSKAASMADVVVTLGGASVGDHDLVRPALAAAGATIDFWKIAMRPGKPLMAGQLNDALVLGLPGNPVSAFVTAHLFLKPLLAHLSGSSDPMPLRSTAVLSEALPANGPRTDHIRAKMAGGIVTPIGQNDSAALLNLARAEVLIVRKPGAPPAIAGEMAETIKIA
jgi:molybdopterin molybdotransferase